MDLQNDQKEPLAASNAAAPEAILHSDSKNSLSSSSYESASSALSEAGDSPTHQNGPAVAPSAAAAAALRSGGFESDYEDDGHHSDGCFSATTNSGGPVETTSPEMTNSTGDSSYHTYPYVSIRRYASALDLSKPIDLSLQQQQPDEASGQAAPLDLNAPRPAPNSAGSGVCSHNEVLQHYLSSEICPSCGRVCRS